jgi:hypothetical protein
MTEHDAERPGREEARAALASIERARAAGLKRGLYPRWFAVAMSLWAGALAATVGSAVWLPLFAAGLLAYVLWCRRLDAWVEEVQTRRDLWLVVLMGLGFGALFIAGYLGRWHYGWAWAQLAAGLVVAVGPFGLTELAHGSARTRPGVRGDS